VNDERYTGELDPPPVIAALDRVASTAG